MKFFRCTVFWASVLALVCERGVSSCQKPVAGLSGVRERVARDRASNRFELRRGREETAVETLFSILRMRGGQPAKGKVLDDGSAVVSDRGLLESVQDRSEDLSVFDDYRSEMLARLAQMDHADVGKLLGSKTMGLGSHQKLAELEEPRRPSLQLPQVDFAAVLGVNTSALRTGSTGQPGDLGGVRLRECDEALLREEDELYASALRGDPSHAGGDPRISKKQRRLARIKALLRCKAAAMTSEAMQEQAHEGVTMPPLETGSAQERELLQKMRDIYRPRTPSPREATLFAGSANTSSQSSHVGAFNSTGIHGSRGRESRQSLDGSCANVSQTEDPEACGPYEEMQHPYLVVRMHPNASTLLYEREKGDLEEGLRAEGVHRGLDGYQASEEQRRRADGGSTDEAQGLELEAGHRWTVMNMSLQNELLQAAEGGDYDGLVRAIASGANLETGGKTPYAVSALHLAARGNHLGVMQQLLMHGQDANAQDQRLATPLHYACDRGCAEAVQLLLYAGANISAADCVGRSPLHRAAVEAPRRVARLLIDAGADVCARDLLLDSPLHVAAIWGNEGVARLLVAAGLRGDDFNRFGHCPVVLADTWERKAVAKFLREHLHRIGEDLEELLRQQSARGPEAASAGGRGGSGRKRTSPGGVPMSQPQSLEKLEKLLEQQRGAGDVRGQTRPRVRQSAPQRENGEGASATAPTAEMPGAKGSRADGTKEEEEDVSDCYTVRHSGFWKRGGLSGLALDEDWGCTEEGTRCSNGIEMVEPYFKLYDQGLVQDADSASSDG